MKNLWLLRAIGLAGFLGLSHIVHAGDLPSDFSHKFELVSTSFALSQATIMVIDHIDPQYDFAGPIFIAGIDILYRIPEIQDNPSHYIPELECDLSGIALDVLWNVLFPRKNR